jgi:large subunit ribosomal protein L9
MKVILLHDVPKVGRRYEVKDLSPGYVRNFLFPKNLAVLATPENLNKIRSEKEKSTATQDRTAALFREQCHHMREEGIHFSRKANNEGHLFAGIRAEDIVDAIRADYGLTIKKEEVVLASPLKEVGEHVVPISCQNEKATLRVAITRE